MQNFTTFFDKNYLSRGLVLIESLQKYSESFIIYVLCLDDFTANFFHQNRKQYPQAILVLLSEIEKSDEVLLSIKSERKPIEYYFTLSPCLPLYLLKKYNLPYICSLDADIQFYSSPQPLFDYLDKYSIIITPHKFSKEVSDLVKWGVNNVSFQIFKNDSIGTKCLELWREQCLEWCKDELDDENNRFADQKYLDNWNILYPNKVKQLYDNVSGLAPWNLNNYDLTMKDFSFLSNGDNLIFYHFHHFKFFSKYWASNGFATYKVKHYSSITKIYKEYWVKVIKKTEVMQLGKENFIRQDFGKNLGRSLINEGSVFLRLSKNIIVPINTSNLFIKIALLFYAKIN